MRLCDVFQKLGEDGFAQLIRGISLGKLKTYQLYDAFKTRSHMVKLNTEHLRKATPKLWARVQQGDEEFAKDLAQAVLVSHLDMIKAVLDFLGIPNEDGFFAKDLDPAGKLTEGWQQRVFDRFRTEYPEALVVFYINHLGLELVKAEEIFKPSAVQAS